MAARLIAITTFGFVLICSGAANAAGWTQPKDAYYVKVWDRTLIGRKIYVTERTTARLPDSYQDHQLNVYGEYGVTDDLTLTLSSAALGFAVLGDEQRLYSGGGAVGVRYRLARQSVSSSVEAKVGFRPSSGNLGSGVVEVNRGDGVTTEAFEAEPSVGTMHGALELQVGYALSFLWLSATAGFQGFTNSRLNPAVYINSQMGWISNFGLVIDLHFNWFHSTGNIGPINIFGAAQTRYLGVGLGASYWFTEDVAITGGLDGVLFATANAATPSLTLGLEFK